MSRTRIRVAGAWVDLPPSGPTGPQGPTGPNGTGGLIGFVSGDLSIGIGTTRLYNDSGMTWTVLSVRASVGEAPTGGSVVVDVNKNGTSLFGTATKPTIAAGTVTDKRVPDVGSTLADGEYFTIDVDDVGDTTPGADLTVQIEVAAA